MLLDTSGLMCLFDKRDHRQAEAIRRYQNAHFCVTTSFVLSEYVALAHVRGMPRQQILIFSAEVLEDKTVEIV